MATTTAKDELQRALDNVALDYAIRRLEGDTRVCPAATGRWGGSFEKRPESAVSATRAAVARPRPATWRSRITGSIPAGARHKNGKRLAIGCFDETLRSGREVVLKMEHGGEPLASTADGSLRLTADGYGLHLEAHPYRTSAGKLAIRAALSREYGLSPGYMSESLSGDQIVAVEGLIEISLVRRPLFGSTRLETVYAD